MSPAFAFQATALLHRAFGMTLSLCGRVHVRARLFECLVVEPPFPVRIQPLSLKAKTPHKGALLLSWWKGEDSNLRTRKRADLQSAAINHSATLPCLSKQEGAN